MQPFWVTNHAQGNTTADVSRYQVDTKGDLASSKPQSQEIRQSLTGQVVCSLVTLPRLPAICRLEEATAAATGIADAAITEPDQQTTAHRYATTYD